MKRTEVDLSKVHVDQFKAEDKSWSGDSLALTKAGWATVTEDGTIVEVIDAFPGELVEADFDARNEIPTGTEFVESGLINPKDIASGGTSGDSVLTGTGSAPVTALASATVDAAFTVSGTTIDTAGSGYADGPVLVTVSAPDSADANLVETYTVSGTLATGNLGLTIADGGQGYTPVVSVTVTGSSGLAPLAEAVLDANGTITDITITDVGGALDTDVLSFSLGKSVDNIQAVVSGTASGGVLTSLTIDNAGAGYVNAPTLTVAAP